MRIAVTTPCGHVGRYLTTMLIRAGIRPLLLVRNPAKIPTEWRDHVDLAVADSTDADQVVAVTTGVDAVYWVDPSVLSADPLADYSRATTAVVHAVEANRISRVVFQSSVGAEKRHGVGEIDGLAATEVALDRLDADVTHLRCGYFFTNLLLDVEAIRRGQLRTVLPVDQTMAWVAPRDIAEVAALTLLNPAWSGHRVQAVHGPQDLSWTDVGHLLSSELGRIVHVERLDDDVMRDSYLTAGMSPAMADAVLGMSTGLRDDFTPEQARTIATTTPTQLRDWVHDNLIHLL